MQIQRFSGEGAGSCCEQKHRVNTHSYKQHRPRNAHRFPSQSSLSFQLVPSTSGILSAKKKPVCQCREFGQRTNLTFVSLTPILSSPLLVCPSPPPPPCKPSMVRKQSEKGLVYCVLPNANCIHYVTPYIISLHFKNFITSSLKHDAIFL